MFRSVRRKYYRYAFGKRSAVARKLGSIVESFERKQGSQDIPLRPEQWNRNYMSGMWAHLHDLSERARFMVTIAYIVSLKPQAAVLDVGCGEGILFRLYRPHGYSRYLGIDISDACLQALTAWQDDKTHFLQADAEHYRPSDTFDVIVFSETLYYFRDPLGTTARYAESLRTDGFFVVSTYARSIRARAILRELKKNYHVIDETEIRRGEKSWFCSVLRPGSPAPGRPE